MDLNKFNLTLFINGKQGSVHQMIVEMRLDQIWALKSILVRQETMVESIDLLDGCGLSESTWPI